MIRKRYNHSSIILGNRFLIVFFGQDEKMVLDSIEYIDLDNPVKFTELKFEWRKFGVTQNWFTKTLIHQINSKEDFLVTKKAKFLIMGGFVDPSSNDKYHDDMN